MDETFWNGKKCKDKDLIGIWWAKYFKNRVGQDSIFDGIIPAQYILLVKLKDLQASACLKLNYGATKQTAKM